MQSLPVRLFHASLSGIVMGLILTLFFFHVQNRFRMIEGNPDLITDVGPMQIPTPSPVPQPVATDPPVDPNDSDGDGIPNDWEIQFHHDPDNDADAASDFDNDGLTALEEYRLYVQTSGTSGNPLGVWELETLEMPSFLGTGSAWPVDINNHDELLVIASYTENNIPRDTAFLIDSNREWTEIRPPGESSGGYLSGYDLNDRGEVVGPRYSADWTQFESYIWDKSAGYRPFTFNGLKAEVFKINNFGDWIGNLEDPDSQSMKPAFVVDGVNQHAAGDWWPYLWYTDINDSGEVMGSYYNPQTSRYQTILAYGSWHIDTGLLGGQPHFDPDTLSWSWSSAMNAYGEFTGGAGGQRDNLWTYLGFHFDGEFNEIQFGGRELSFLSPESLNASNTIVGYAEDSARSGVFIFRDGVGLFLEELLQNTGSCYAPKINSKGQIITIDTFTNQIFVISPDQDQDGDGMSDDWEEGHGLNKNSATDANGDADNDGTNNLGEFLLRSNPNAAPVLDPNGQAIDLRPGIDTDGDGIPNVWEWNNGLNYDDASDAPLDYDRDGYTNLQEFRLNTDPRGAPSYRMRVVGPFTGAASASLGSATLGDGITGGSGGNYLGANLTETVYFSARPSLTTNGGQRPAAWSILRGSETGNFSFSTSHGSATTYPLAQSPAGAALTQIYGSPDQFVFWSSPSAQPLTLSGAASQNDIDALSNPRISPSGAFVVGSRTLASATSVRQPVVWKMPLSPTATFRPIPLVAPPGAGFSGLNSLFVNDHGYVLANGTVSGQSRPILWKVSADGLSATASLLPPLPGSTWANATGISNQDPPLICGNSSATDQDRAVVWTAAGTVTNLGTIPGGNSSSASLISRGGEIAGVSNILIGKTLRQQPFLASYDAGTASWKLQSQGDPLVNTPTLASLNDSGEILGTITEDSPVYRQIRTLWRHGRAHTIESCLAQAAGTTVENVSHLSLHGSLLATAWKNDVRMTVLLTPDRDVDGDGLPDAFENQHGFNAFVKNHPATDSDSDGLSDLDEFRNATHPRNPDTDSDGMKDGWEVSWGLLPLDPTDALLDPDGDRVPNLRESEIGATPTGTYKVETRITDTTSSYPTVVAASDDNKIVYAGECYWNSYFDENADPRSEYRQEHYALPSEETDPNALPMILIPSQGYDSYTSDWTAYSYSHSYPTYRPDPATGRVNADLYRLSYDSENDSYFESYFLIPDAANHLDEADWIPLADVETNLRNPDLHGGTAPLSEYDTLYLFPAAISPSGLRRLYQASNGTLLILDEHGGFIGTIQGGSWTMINDHGIAVRIGSRYIPPANGKPGRTVPCLNVSTGQTHDIPRDPSVSTTDTLIAFSNDGKALLRRQIRNEQLANQTQFFLLDTTTATFTRVRQPGIGSESINMLSNQNGRLLGSGPKPFQITPDGTCIRLDALRIKNDPADPPEPLSDIYRHPLTPHHLTSDGRITVTTTNTEGLQVIIQIVPHNDADGDGLPDDWEASEANHLAASNPQQWSELAQNHDLDSNVDYWGDGYTANQSFLLGFSTSNRSPSSEKDSDADGLVDTDDADPLDAAVDWERSSEASYAVIEIEGWNPESHGQPLTLNNRGDVLFQSAIWSLKEPHWRTLNNHVITPTYTYNGEAPITIGGTPRFLDDEGRILGNGLVMDSQWALEWSFEGGDPFIPGAEGGGDILSLPWLMQASMSRDGFRLFVTSSENVWSVQRSHGAGAPNSTSLQFYQPSYPGPGLGNTIVWGGHSSITNLEENGNTTSGFIWSPEGENALIPGPVVVPSWPGDQSVIGLLPDRLDLSSSGDHSAVSPVRGYVASINGNVRFLRTDSGQWTVPKRLPSNENQFSNIQSINQRGEAIRRQTHSTPSLPSGVWRNGRWISLTEVLSHIKRPNSQQARFTDVDPIELTEKGLILCEAVDAENPSTNPTGAKRPLLLVPVEVAVDADRNGEITFDGKDKTTADKPFRFWINDDRDIKHNVDRAPPPFGHNGDWEEDDVNADEQENPDCDVPGLNYRRDLEDLTRIWIDFAGIDSVFPSGNPTVALKFRFDADFGNPEINLFQPVEAAGGIEFLKDEAIGGNQLQGVYGQELCKVTGSSSVELPRRAWDNLPSNKVVHLLFEGAKVGDGKLIFELWKNGVKVCEIPSVILRLRKANDFYETWTVGDSTKSANIVQWNDYSVWPKPSAQWELGTGNDLVPPMKPEEKDYIMFIHGWNMSPVDKTQFSDTMYKRLWHQGYKGRFGVYRWPTFFTPNVQINNFNGSEQRAWNSGAQLADLIRSKSKIFNDKGKSLVRIFGHSMGNIVCSEALRTFGKNAPVHTYISGQAALAAHCWDAGNTANGGPRLMPSNPLNQTTSNVYRFYWHSTVSPDFPDDWIFNAQPSYMHTSYMPSDVKYVNHYNIDDWALNSWELNQQLKPSPDYSYESVRGSIYEIAFYRKEPGVITPRRILLSFPQDRFEVFSWAAEARSFATGAEPATAGMFSESVDLRAAPYNFDDKHKGHSAQFRSTIHKRWVYWSKFLDDCAIPYNL